MSTIERRRSGGVAKVDRALGIAAVVGGVLVVLWALHAVVGMLLFGLKVVVLVVVVALLVRLVRAVRR
ncbi:MAG: hypothetical protein M0Z63_06030 [Actinomycetota bacterium]|jgi:hypothetical protein|nr:hypothetical protein [Actinomycetota bacterium]MDA8279970.1 hypothetical protein [Actinomycetota bacterium]